MKYFKDSLKSIKLDLTKLILIPSGGYMDLNNEFEINPKDFYRYAKEDLYSATDRGVINAISNAKRAIDCQIDEVLFTLGIDLTKKTDSLEAFLKIIEINSDIPYKLKIIQALNIAPGLIITKYRNLRNRLEHFYKIPTIDEVKEAIDIADLFIRSVEGQFKGLTTEFDITDANNFIKDFEYKAGYELIYIEDENYFSIYEKMSGKRANEIIMTPDNLEFYGFIRLMHSIDDEFEMVESFKIIARLIEHPIPQKHISMKQR